MVAPEFFALNATNGAIGNLFLGHAIVDHVDRKSAAQVAEDAKSFHRLASGPKPNLVQAVARQICPTNSHGMFQEAHGVPPGGMIAPASEACLHANSDRAIAFPDIRLRPLVGSTLAARLLLATRRSPVLPVAAAAFAEQMKDVPG
jgi:hypothetical protein